MNWSFVVGEMVGALIATFLLSRLTLWILKSWTGGGIQRLAAGHGMSLMVAALLGGITLSENGQFAGAAALATYFLPQMVWLVVDIINLRRGNVRA